MVMTVSVGTIKSIMMIKSHCSRNGKSIFASAYPASPLTHNAQDNQDRRIEKGIPIYLKKLGVRNDGNIIFKEISLPAPVG